MQGLLSLFFAVGEAHQGEYCRYAHHDAREQ